VVAKHVKQDANLENISDVSRMQRMGGGSSDPVCGSCPFPGTGACPFYARGGKRGGACGCGGRFNHQTQVGGSCGCMKSYKTGGGSQRGGSQRGGGCGCGGPLFQGGGSQQRGGYRATRRNLKYLKQWKKGKSIGFTMTASLKAKGLIPRSSKTMKGKRVVSKKYKH
jgi:hypothetical protein